ncbi:MAG: DUF4276 family protein [Chloroflexi bacterium]|nr:DUF4276 family protein [Chloroflexota bacterium]
MKPQLALVFYTEGPTDMAFLQPLVVRACQSIFTQHNVPHIEVVEPFPVNEFLTPKGKISQAKRILQAAHFANNHHALLVHNDADKRTRAKTIQFQFQPGYDEVHRQSLGVCKQLLPIIPIRMIEAWLLADVQTLCREMDTDLTPVQLGLPLSPAAIEGNTDPKQTLEEALRKANAKRSKATRVERGNLYPSLGLSIDLKQLERLSAYQDFITDLTSTIKHLNMIY